MDQFIKNLNLRRLTNNFFDKRSKISIGKHTYGRPNVLSYGSTSKLCIGKFCSIGKKVTIILNAEHRHDWVSTFPFPAFIRWNYKDSEYLSSKGDIIIGNDVWIGYGVTILSGVKIGDGAIIGANSLVTKDVEPYTIIGGNPAKVIKKRFSDRQIKNLLNIKWWEWSDKKIKENLSFICSSDVNKFINKFL
jgi:lipopolysaccharide transport system ATP-binding protein